MSQDLPSTTPDRGPGSRSSGATVLACGSILLWCWSGICFTQGARLLDSSMVYLTFMTGIGALTVFALQVMRRRPVRELVCLPGRVMVAGFWGVAFYTVILAMAFGMAEDRDVGQVNLLNYLWPIWIVLLSTVVLADRPNPAWTIAGALLGFAGIVVARGLETLGGAPTTLLPHAMALVGGFLWALYCVLLRRWRIPEENGGTAFHFTICAVMAALIAASLGQWPAALDRIGPEAIFWMGFGGIGPVGLAYHWWEIGVKRGNVQLISLLAYFTPIGSSILIGLFFNEALTPGLIPGAVMITVGAWMVRRSDGGRK